MNVHYLDMVIGKAHSDVILGDCVGEVRDGHGCHGGDSLGTRESSGRGRVVPGSVAAPQ